MLRWTDGTIFIGNGNMQGISCGSREIARKIISHFVTRKITFAFEEIENYHYVYFSESVDLDRLRKFGEFELML